MCASALCALALSRFGATPTSSALNWMLTAGGKSRRAAGQVAAIDSPNLTCPVSKRCNELQHAAILAAGGFS